MNHFVFANGGESLTFSSENGKLISYFSDGIELLEPSEQAFVLRFLDENDEFLTITETDFQPPQKKGNLICWDGCSRFPSLKFSLEVKNGNNGFRFFPRVSGIPNILKLDFCEPVRITVPYDDQLMFPTSEGYIANRARKASRPILHWDSPVVVKMTYPGFLQMQFLFASNGKAGLYLAADDYTHSLKTMEFHSDIPEKKIGLRIELHAGESYGKPEYEAPCELILRRTAPEWQTACEIYREWVKSDPMMQKKAPHPKWLDEPLSVIVYPVCGRGPISVAPNKFIPYENALPLIEKLAESFGTRVMVLLMRWDHNGPWMPPFYWPPVGGVDSFRKLRDGLHARGHLLGVYGSGTSYTMKSKINDYSGEAYYQAHELADSMVCGYKGERIVNSCDAIRTSEAFCLTEDAGKAILTEQTMILADEKVDFFQILDQNLGGCNFPCYAKNHHHPPIPGRWQYESMRIFLDELNRKIAESGSQMLLGCECAAAGPLLTAMPFNDLRDNFNFPNGLPVPAFSYVFHKYANNFHGNQCLMGQLIDFEKCPDNLQYRLAYGFSMGSILTVTLRDTGEIDWGAAADWDKNPPPQEPAVQLIRELNKIRKNYTQFLIHGEMTKPRHKLECGTYEIFLQQKDLESLKVPSVMQSAWQSSCGYAEFFVNFLSREQKISIDGKEFRIAPLSVLVRED